MVIGELTSRVRILLEKDCQDTIFLKISNSRKYPEVPISPEDGSIQKRDRGEPPGTHTTPSRGLALAAPPGGVATLAHLYQFPFAYIIFSKT
jgi:hypothetical protein